MKRVATCPASSTPVDRKNEMDAMKKHLFVLLACLFVVMIGFGITLPVLPFYVESARTQKREHAAVDRAARRRC